MQQAMQRAAYIVCHQNLHLSLWKILNVLIERSRLLVLRQADHARSHGARLPLARFGQRGPKCGAVDLRSGARR